MITEVTNKWETCCVARRCSSLAQQGIHTVCNTRLLCLLGRHDGLTLTAVGARRGLLVGLLGVGEDVGLIGMYHEGTFVKLTPWVGDVEWDVEPWGR